MALSSLLSSLLSSTLFSLPSPLFCISKKGFAALQSPLIVNRSIEIDDIALNQSGVVVQHNINQRINRKTSCDI